MENIENKEAVCLAYKIISNNNCENSNISNLISYISNQKTVIQKFTQTKWANYLLIIVLDEFNIEETAEFVSLYSTSFRKIIILLLFEPKEKSDTIKKLSTCGCNEIISKNETESVGNKVIFLINRWNTIYGIIKSLPEKFGIAGSSLVWKNFLFKVIEYSMFTDCNILLTGESGTGKELIAKLMHKLDQRENKKELITLDCTTIHPELSGSELFGHERGSFTGAIYSREGTFELANNGTLFLDEISELKTDLQSELLRVLQTGDYKRVGSNQWRNSRFRLICASNKSLISLVKKGVFRKDLYYRVAMNTLRLPNLNERKEDIPELIDFFVRKYLKHTDPSELDPLLEYFLLNKKYKGNIRELEMLIWKIARISSDSSLMTLANLGVDSINMSELNIEKGWNNERFQKCIHDIIFEENLKEDAFIKEIKKISAIEAYKVLQDKNKVAEKLGIKSTKTIDNYLKF